MENVKWHTHKTLYVDIETGEQIQHKRIKEYVLIKTDRKVKLNYNKTIGHIQYIMNCKLNPQLKLKL